MIELTPDEQQHVEELLEQVLRVEAEARPALLDSASAELAVRKEVESLMTFHAVASESLESPIVTPAVVVEAVDEITTRGPGDPASMPERWCLPHCEGTR